MAPSKLQLKAVALVRKELAVLGSLKKATKAALFESAGTSAKTKQQTINETLITPRPFASDQTQSQIPNDILPATSSAAANDIPVKEPPHPIIPPTPEPPSQQQQVPALPKSTPRMSNPQSFPQHTPVPSSSRQQKSPVQPRHHQQHQQQQQPFKSESRLQQPLSSTSRVTSHKPPRDFVTSAQVIETITTTSTGLKRQNKNRDIAISEKRLQDADAKLRDAMRKLDIEKARAEQAAKLERERKKRAVKKLYSKGKSISRGVEDVAPKPESPENTCQDNLNEESVLLDFELNDLGLSNQSPPRGMKALYRDSRSPSPTRSATKGIEGKVCDDGVWQYNGYSAAEMRLYSARPQSKFPGSLWRLRTDEMITLLDIPPTAAFGSDTLKTTLSDATTVLNINQNNEQTEAQDSDDQTAIIIEHEPRQARPSTPKSTQSCGVQTIISQPSRITLPKRMYESIRKGKDRFHRYKSIGSTGHPLFEPIDAIETMADELLNDVLKSIVGEITLLSEEFVQSVISSEFV